MKRVWMLVRVVVALQMPGHVLAAAAARAAEPLALSVDPAKILNRIDEKVYGHFLEHLYRSCNGGLWGEIIWNRSFEIPDGTPEERKPGCKQWEPYGQARIEQSKDNPLNSEFCLMIEGDGPEAGVEQTPLCIRKDETYRGSLWARGHAAGGLVVRLRDGTNVLQEIALPAPGDAWKEFPLQFTAAKTAEDATIQIGLRGKGRIALDQVSLMADSSAATGGYRPDLLQAIADLRPPVIRWPGGSFTTHYRWKDAIGPQSKRGKYPRPMWEDQDVNSYGTDEFVAMCRKIGSEPLIVINLGRSAPREQRPAYLQEACDWVEYCNGPATSTWGKVRAANGHPQPYQVKYWEIDNETWKLKPDDYASAVRDFVTAMKKIDPSIITIACGGGQLGRSWPHDGVIIANCSDVADYLSVHHYEDPNRFAVGPAEAEKFWPSLGEKIAVAKNPRMKLYVSEWNAQSTDWRTGLYAGASLNVFERCGDHVGMAAPALFLRHVSATTKRWDNAFINFDHKGWFPAPNYVVMKLWRDHYAPLRVDLSGATAPLDAIATRTEDGRTVLLKVVNPTDRPVPVRLAVKAPFVVADAALDLVTAPSLQARNTLADPHAVRATRGKAEIAGQEVRFELPPLTAAVLTVR